MAERYLRSRIDGEAIWVDLAGGDFFGLNDPADHIVSWWRSGVRDPAEIAKRLTEIYDVTAEVARPAVERTIEKARLAGLLEP